jgi:hypothetical protein
MRRSHGQHGAIFHLPSALGLVHCKQGWQKQTFTKDLGKSLPLLGGLLRISAIIPVVGNPMVVACLDSLNQKPVFKTEKYWVAKAKKNIARGKKYPQSNKPQILNKQYLWAKGIWPVMGERLGSRSPLLLMVSQT